EALEHAGGEPFLLAQQAEQDVFRPDVVVLERTGLVLGQNDDLARPLGEPFEHRAHMVARTPRLRSTPTGRLFVRYATNYWRSRRAGKRITPRSESLPLKTMAGRSMPIPSPPVGGIPYESAST